MRYWKLAELNLEQVRSQTYEVAVLPLGATEPHNLHLPYGTDSFSVECVANRVCAAAAAEGAKVVLLPTIPFGTETNLLEFPLAMNVQPSTLFLVLADLVASLEKHGIRKVVLINGHGGNELKPLLRELFGRTTAQLFLCNWFQVAADAYGDIFAEKDDHAGEMETSVALDCFPDLVARTPEGHLAADAGQTRASRFEAVNRGWVQLTRPWHLLTTNSGAGNPHAASAAKGEAFVRLVVERLSQFLVELSASPLDERFPY